MRQPKFGAKSGSYFCNNTGDSIGPHERHWVYPGIYRSQNCFRPLRLFLQKPENKINFSFDSGRLRRIKKYCWVIRYKWRIQGFVRIVQLLVADRAIKRGLVQRKRNAVLEKKFGARVRGRLQNFVITRTVLDTNNVRNFNWPQF